MTARPLSLRPLVLPSRILGVAKPSLPGPFAYRVTALALRFGPDFGPLGGLTRLLNGGVMRLFANERGVLSLPLCSIRPLHTLGAVIEPPTEGIDVGHGRAMPLPSPIDVAAGEVLSATVAVGEGECPDVPLELVVVCEAAEAKEAA